MKLLLIALLPLILVSSLVVSQSIICCAIGVPVLVLWIVSSLVALIPDHLPADPGK